MNNIHIPDELMVVVMMMLIYVFLLIYLVLIEKNLQLFEFEVMYSSGNRRSINSL